MAETKSLYRTDDLFELSDLLLLNNYNVEQMTVSIEVPSQEFLNKINEELYYRGTENNATVSHLSPVDEILINVQGLRIKYVVKQTEEE